jgi:hypothetical protein
MKSTKMQLYEFAKRIEKEFSMFTCLSTNTYSRSAWYLENGASCHMIRTYDLFTSWPETDLCLHVDLDTHGKCGVGVGIVRFHLESGGFQEVEYVLYVPKLKNLLSISVLEEMGFLVTFREGKYSYVQREIVVTQQWELVLEREGYIGSRSIL